MMRLQSLTKILRLRWTAGHAIYNNGKDSHQQPILVVLYRSLKQQTFKYLLNWTASTNHRANKTEISIMKLIIQVVRRKYIATTEEVVRKTIYTLNSNLTLISSNNFKGRFQLETFFNFQLLAQDKDINPKVQIIFSNVLLQESSKIRSFIHNQYSRWISLISLPREIYREGCRAQISKEISCIILVIIRIKISL